MAAIRSAALSAALLLASCGGPKPLVLPQQGPDRAATCGVVAAAEARVKIDVKSPLPLATQGLILHYALLEGSSGGEFDAESAGTVSRRMTALQEQVTGGKWQSLGSACASAYPETRAKAVKLPAGQFEAQLACVELADFLTRALASQETNYGNELAAWSRMRRETNDALAPGLRSRAGGDLAAQQRLRRKALADAARLGPPVALMEQCVKRFGSEPS